MVATQELPPVKLTDNQRSWNMLVEAMVTMNDFGVAKHFAYDIGENKVVIGQSIVLSDAKATPEEALTLLVTVPFDAFVTHQRTYIDYVQSASLSYTKKEDYGLFRDEILWERKNGYVLGVHAETATDARPEHRIPTHTLGLLEEKLNTILSCLPQEAV